MDMNIAINSLNEKAANLIGETYTGADGLKYCTECNTPTQAKINILGCERTVNIMCKCRSELYEQEQKNAEDSKRAEQIHRYINGAFGNSLYRKMTFEQSDVVLSREMRYCDNFDTMLKENQGLMLIGNQGTGKTYAAACIANKVLQKGYSVQMENVTDLCMRMQRTFESREEVLNELTGYSLLVLDDLGAERNTDYMTEMLYSIIDSRYRAEKPLIITTNLKLKEMKEETDIRKARIYDRLFEMCPYPLSYTRESRRKSEGNRKYVQMKALLEGGENNDIHI